MAEESRLITALGPHLDSFVATLFGIEAELADITADPTGTNVAKRYAAQAIMEGPDQAEGYAVSGTIRSRVDWDWWNALADAFPGWRTAIGSSPRVLHGSPMTGFA